MTWAWVFAALNIGTSLIVALVVAFLMGAMGHKFTALARISMSLIGAGMLLSIGPILMRPNHGVSPFDDWSLTITRLGLMGAFADRLCRHWWNNVCQRWSAKKHLKERGKL